MVKRSICAAAQDDLGGASDSGEEAPRKRKLASKAPSPSGEKLPSTTSQGVTGDDGVKRKKEKEFAWMDSEEEEETDKGTAKDTKKRSKSRSGSRSRRPSGDGDFEDADADVSIEVLDEVQTFGKMVILAPALQKQLRRMSSDNVSSACRAMARTKFFDGDILKDLNDVLKRLLQREQLTASQTTDALQCLAELNAYDQGVLSAVAMAF